MKTTKHRRDYEEFRGRVAATGEAEIAWFAGWLSADGSVKVADRYGRPAVRFQICDRDPLDRFAELFGNRVVGPIAQHAGAFGTKPVFEWRVSGMKAVALLERCLPWLSARYAERARDAMRYAVGRAAPGAKITPEQVAEIKAQLAVGGHGIGRRLARQYGVTDGLISAIRHGRVWV